MTAAGRVIAEQGAATLVGGKRVAPRSVELKAATAACLNCGDVPRQFVAGGRFVGSQSLLGSGSGSGDLGGRGDGEKVLTIEIVCFCGWWQQIRGNWLRHKMKLFVVGVPGGIANKVFERNQALPLRQN
jgi:hypothetical protein